MLSPGAEAVAWGREVAEALAGAKAEVVSLSERGARNLRRPLSRAEVQVVRTAVAGDGLLVGYVCAGTAVPGMCPVDVRSVVVTDHVNLTWRSPLTGPNDECFGPRFPVVAGVYRPEAVAAVPESGSVLGVVAGVRDDRCLTAFEAEVVVRHGIQAVSSELVAVSIVAAHMGFRVAAVVVVDGVCEMPSRA